MRVNCNISAIIANNQLMKAQSNMDKTIERLSSGFKINHAEDDAAGLATANKLHTQIKGLDRAQKNSADGVSVVETADSVLSEVGDMLQRMNELAIQAANGTNSINEREAIQEEIDGLTSEIDRISASTEFNTIPLLDGSLSRRCYADVDGVSMFSIGDEVLSGKYEVTINQLASRASLPAQIDENALAGISETQSFRINGMDVDINPGDSVDEVKSKIVDAAGKAGLTYEDDTFYSAEYGSSENIEFDPGTAAGIINFGAVTRGTDAQIDLSGDFSETAVAIQDGNKVKIRDNSGFEMVLEIDPEIVTAPVTINENVTDMGRFTVQFGANEGQVLNIDIPRVDCHTLEVDKINVSTQQGALAAIDSIKYAIDKVSSVRAKLGSYQNRLESGTEYLAAYEENITSSLSRIEDMDMAEGMTEYTQQNVITQAATSIIAQANERPQSVLQLLQ